MDNHQSRREGQSAAGQSSFVSVPRDGSLRTPSFRSRSDGCGDLCAPNDPNGRGARRRSGELKDQQASPASVAARRAYDDSGRRPDDGDDAQHRRDVDRVDQWLQHGGSQPDAAPHTLRQRRRTRSSAGLRRNDALHNASDEAAARLHESGASLLGGAADEEPQEPPRKKAKSKEKAKPPPRSAVASLLRLLGEQASITEATSTAALRLGPDFVVLDSASPLPESGVPCETEASGLGDQFVASRSVEGACYLVTAHRGRGVEDTVLRAAKSGRDDEAARASRALFLRLARTAARNSSVVGPKDVLIPVPRSTETASTEASFPHQLATAIGEETGACVLSLLLRVKGKTPRGDATTRRSYHENSFKVDPRALRDLLAALQRGATRVRFVDDDVGSGGTYRGASAVVKVALGDVPVDLGLLAGARYYHDKAPRPLKPSVAEAFITVATLCYADGGATHAGAHAMTIYGFGAIVDGKMNPYEGSHLIPVATWAALCQPFAKALDAARTGDATAVARLRELGLTLVAKRLDEHDRAAAGGTHNPNANAFHAARSAVVANYKIRDDAQLKVLIVSRDGESRRALAERGLRVEQRHLKRLFELGDSAAPARYLKLYIGGEVVPINAARVAAGADSLNELVVDPRTGKTCRRCETLDVLEKRSQSASRRLKDYHAALSEKEKTERLDKARENGFGDGSLISAGVEDAHADGAYAELYARRRAEALARIEADRVKGGALAAKADSREKDIDRCKKNRKRKKERKEAVARDEAELKERVLVLRERLGHGPTEVVLVEDDYDEYGGLFETKGYKADVAALAKLEDENTDALAIKKKRNAMSKKRSRAFQRVAAEKAEGRVEALAGLAEKLEEEECYLGELLSLT